VHPYDYVNCMDKLSERSLPPKDKFYSRLNDEDVTDDDYYNHAKTVWREFGMKTLRDYLKLYNITDVLLLADVFENFRDVCLEHYKLDPAWYYTAPSLSWDAMMKTTKIKLELLSDVDMLRMVQQGIRGGMTAVPKRYAEANNKYMGDNYDTNKSSKYILYLDVNALYSWAMTNRLPTDGFEWMTEKELNNRNISCILEVDLDYPEELHDLHNEYPLAPENIKVGDVKIEKLVPNLRPKEKYMIHSETLKLYESLGLKITKIHRGISFYPHDAMLARVIAIATCLSVCLSVTSRYCVKTKKASVMISSPSGSPKTLVF